MSTVRAILIIISLLFFITASIPIQGLLNFTNTKYKRKFPLFFYKSVKAIIGLHIIKKDLDKSQEGDTSHGILYVANHVSWFDIICLGSILNARFIKSKLEVGNICWRIRFWLWKYSFIVWSNFFRSCYNNYYYCSISQL